MEVSKLCCFATSEVQDIVDRSRSAQEGIHTLHRERLRVLFADRLLVRNGRTDPCSSPFTN